MDKCKACGREFASTNPKNEICYPCENALKRLNGYAVPVDDVKEFAQDVAYQFGHYCKCDGRLHITHGGLSVLEEAFEILGWGDLHPCPECECEIDGCHEHATCGAPTNGGYKRMCGRHYHKIAWGMEING